MIEPVRPRDAATVMLVRDGDAGMEVFMLRRNLASVFVAGAHVFPGGAVDEADRHAGIEGWCDGRTDAEASALLGVGAGGLAYWVAAIRETFEEAGILLARRATGQLIRFDDPAVEARFAAHRLAVDSGTLGLVDLCAEERLRLAVDTIHYFGHWITPVGSPRRYDTRFFVAAAPEGQVPLHDDRETIAHEWLRPADALARHRAGELDLILPTVRSLRAIAGFERAADLLAAASGAGPRLVADSGGRRIALPVSGER